MLIDTHCHLTSDEYTKTIKELVLEAAEAGVTKLITVGTSIKENAKVVDTVKEFKNVYGIIGIYPDEELGENIEDLKKALEKQINSSGKIVGIGECGFEITETNKRPVSEQKKLFEMQIELALKYDLPLVIHNRNGDEILLETLNKYRNKGLRGVAHCFVSDWEIAEKLIEHGFYISFSGIITYKSGQNLYESVKNVPLDKVLLETDSPWLSPENKKGKREKINEPKYVTITALKFAELRKIPLETVIQKTSGNAHKLFTLK